MKAKVVHTVFIAILLIVLATLQCGATARAEENPSASIDVGAFSKYIWRGFELSDDSIVIQPSMTVGYKGFGVNLWGNLDTNYDDPAGNDTSNFNETDLTLSYDTTMGPVDVGVGYIYYALDSVDDSQEFYLSIGLNTFLSPTLTVYREVAHYPGWYFSLGISYSFELPKGITLDLAGSAGYYDYDDDAFSEVDDHLNPTGHTYSNFHNGLLSAGLAIPAGKYVTVNPMIAYSFPLSNDADNFITASSMSGDSDFFYGGITVSFSF